jgi:hypothetical protein
MTTKQAWVGLLGAVVVASSVAATSTGCKYFKKGDTDESSSSQPAPPPEPEPSAEATGTATAAANEVKTYPNQIAASGTYRLLRSFFVYQEADTNSKRLGGVGEGTIIHLKATLGQWLLIEWPSAPGTMSPGWVQVAVHGNRPDPTMVDEVREVDAGVVDAGILVDAGIIVDAGKPVVDAGKPIADAGTRRPRIELKQKKK